MDEKWRNSKNIYSRFSINNFTDGGQNKTPYETAILKSKIAEGMHHNGKVILNRDMNEYFTVKSTIENIIRI